MKQHVTRALRIIVSVGLLVWVLNRADLASLMERISSAKLEWLLAAFLVNSLGNLFGAFRWHLLLRSQKRIVGVFYLFGSYLVGLFFNNFLPSTIGGDVIRAMSAKKKGGGTMTEGLTVVLVERMIGLFATLTLGGLAALTGRAGELDPRIPWVLGSALIASMGG
ncbi:MAG: flippase-like domain-containing protein, partial [Gemmatimonadetes bacterium]|nr:flippase-like domain-containing protein [Gemmatimonadota bacterium]